MVYFIWTLRNVWIPKMDRLIHRTANLLEWNGIEWIGFSSLSCLLLFLCFDFEPLYSSPSIYKYSTGTFVTFREFWPGFFRDSWCTSFSNLSFSPSAWISQSLCCGWWQSCRPRWDFPWESCSQPSFPVCALGWTCPSCLDALSTAATTSFTFR